MGDRRILCDSAGHRALPLPSPPLLFCLPHPPTGRGTVNHLPHRGAVGVPVNFSSDVGEAPGRKGAVGKGGALLICRKGWLPAQPTPLSPGTVFPWEDCDWKALSSGLYPDWSAIYRTHQREDNSAVPTQDLD